MTDWLPRILDRIERALEQLEDTITEILTDLAGRNEGYNAHEKMLGALIHHVEEQGKRIAKLETKQARMEGRQQAEDLQTASTPWWRDWWAVTFMMLMVVPVTLASMLALGLLTPDQASQAAKAAVQGLLQSLGISD